MEWISVKDGLPETNIQVLACKHNGKVIQMSYHRESNDMPRNFYWWGFGGYIEQTSQVTHWMPLPAPPTKTPPTDNVQLSKQYAAEVHNK